jgi:putative ABC transport system permease protein
MSILRRITNLFHRSKLDQEIEAELRSHIEMRTADNMAAGMSPEEARRQAVLRFGSRAALKERVIAADAQMFVDSLWQDLRYALRTLRKSPGFAAVAVLTLALGIGGSTALFSVVNALVLRELPVRDPGQLVSFYTTHRNGDWAGITVLQLRELKRYQNAFTGLFGRSYPDNSNVESNGNIWPINLGRVTGQYYSVLGVKPALGRLITPEDAGISRGTPSAVAVIGYDLWQRQYRGSQGVIGKTISIANKPFTIIGVTPKGFFGEQVGFSLDVTIPITETPSMETNFPNGPWCQYGVGRLKQGVSLSQARAELESIWPRVRAAAIPAGLNARQLAEVQTEGFRVQAYPKNGYSYLRDQFATPLYALTEISGLILLIACVNLAMLLLARASRRRHEMAIRAALGASRFRLVRQLQTESLILSISGAALGVGLMTWASRWLVSFWRQIPFNPPTVINVKLDPRILLFAGGLAMTTGILFGLAPAWHGSREAPAMALQEVSRTASRDTRLAGRLLVTLQIALSLVLVAAGGLLMRSLKNIHAVRPGFGYRDVAVMQLQGVTGGNEDFGDNYYQNLVRNLSNLPGVRSVALSQMIPGAGFDDTEAVKRGDGEAVATVDADAHVVSPEFFQTLMVGFVQGHDFTWNDNEHTPRVAVISESLAERLFPNGDSIGRFIHVGSETEHQNVQVVGVVRDARIKDIRVSSPFAVYVPFLQAPKYWTNVEIRSAGPPSSVLASAQRSAEAMEKEYVFNAESLEQIIDGAIANERALALVSGFFSALALLIAVVGLGGLMSYTVAQRTHEIGVRMALGAHPGNVMGMLIREGMLLVGMGIIIGTAVALAVGRYLQSLLFGIGARDPATIAGSAALLAAVALVACYIPARRAMRVDPMVALRYD